MIVTLLLLAAFTGRTTAQCLSGDCQTGKGVMLYPQNERYVGQFWEGRKHGEGVYFYRNGSRYQGQWSNDQPHGNGFKQFEDGTRLSGFWEKGKLVRREQDLTAQAEPEASVEVEKGSAPSTGCISGDCTSGKGIYLFPTGAVYVGDFRDGEIHGVGVCYYSDGSKYHGEWAHRYPDGRGTKSYPDGTKRTGLWRKGYPIDQTGNLVDEKKQETVVEASEIQTGCIAGNCQTGQGTFAYPDGSRYEGQFFRGKPEGWGAFTAIDGEKYTGGFKEGYRHGRGRLERPDGSIQTGEWRSGEYLGQTPVARNSGCIMGDCANGSGTFVFGDGAKYVGAFKNGKPHGQGILYYTNGNRYEGAMENGMLHGQGTLVQNNGAKVSGRWQNGSYLSPTVLTMGSKPSNSATPSLMENTAKPASSMQAPQSTPTTTNLNIKVWAVVIGVAAYNHMPVLRYTDDDAYRVYAFLKSPEGGALDDSQIRILIDEDATKKKIVEAMELTFTQAGPNDLVLLYFSGHGLKGSFLPIDFDGYNNKLNHEEINSLLRKSPARYKLCIADACHSGSLLSMRSGAEQPTLLSYYESLAKAQPGTALIMSSKSEETSLESSGLRQGVFSHFLIRGLKGEADLDTDKIVSIQELYEYIQNNVKSYTGNRQSPVIQGDYDRKMTVAAVRR